MLTMLPLKCSCCPVLGLALVGLHGRVQCMCNHLLFAGQGRGAAEEAP